MPYPFSFFPLGPRSEGSLDSAEKSRPSKTARVLVVTEPKWKKLFPHQEVVSPEDYLTKEEFKTSGNLRVYNFCGSYSYQESGYYVSLLASARKHKIFPALGTILDLKNPTQVKMVSAALDDLIQKSLHQLKTDRFELSVYFGKNLAKRYDKLAQFLASQLGAPLLRAKFVRREKWHLTHVAPIALRQVPAEHYDEFREFALAWFASRRSRLKVPDPTFSLAILLDPEEKHPPSNAPAIQKFREAASKLSIDTEIIGRDEIHRLVEFDALFIRVTTAVNHFTWRFAQKARALGLFVVDDPDSILKCTNKIYLAELFASRHIPAPRTEILHSSNYRSICKTLSLPQVLKQPDSSFSQGVIKVHEREELIEHVKQLLQNSDLVLAQEFLPTGFDWRIGVLNGRAIYVCKYFMARNHWQIYNVNADGTLEDGYSEAVPLSAVSTKLIGVAEKAAGAIGDGLYGVDVKEVDGKYYVIEVNDNPSLDAGCEDELLGDDLYRLIMNHFLQKMQVRKRGPIAKEKI